ncbi:MAG: O-antigen ligase family protein [Candidatus Eisenbacteria bacterium]
MTNDGPARRSSAAHWLAVAVALVCVSLVVAAAPLGVAAAVVAAAAATVLVVRFGPLEGLWYLALASVPLRHALAIDVRGTVSLFPTDLLFFGLLALAASRGRLRGLVRESLVMKLGLALVLLSLPGLFTASRVFWGVAAVYRLALQLSAFALAYAVVRDGKAATRTLWALLVGILPAAVYGVYQSTLPVDSAALPDWASHLIAYGATGTPNLRAFSTFDHTLRFSHYLTVSFGVALGLLLGSLSRARKALAGLTAAVVAYANLFTYSIAGLLGTVAAMGSAIFLVRRKRALLWLLPVLVGALLLASPAALLNKADKVLRGDATTTVARVVTYKQAFNILRDHPLQGVGWGGIRSSLEHEYRLTRAQAVAFGAENYFLQRAMALGIPGLVLSLWLACLYFRNTGRSARAPSDWPRAALAVSGVAYFVQAQTFPAAAPASGVLLWTLLALTERMRAAAAAEEGRALAADGSSTGHVEIGAASGPGEGRP